VPAVLLMTAAALAAQGVAERLPAGRARRATAAALVPLAVFVAYDYRSDAGPRLGMSAWSGQIAQATAACAGRPDDEVRVLTVAPTPEWTVHITCGTLRGSA
jgi:hypothetical protein